MGRGARKESGRAPSRSVQERFAAENLQGQLLQEGRGDKEVLLAEIARLPEDGRQFAQGIDLPEKYTFLRWHRALEWLRETSSNALTENMQSFLRLENGEDESKWAWDLAAGDMHRIEKQMRTIEGVRAVLEDLELQEIVQPLLRYEAEIRQDAALQNISNAPVIVVPNKGWIDPRTEDELLRGESDNESVGFATFAAGSSKAFLFPEACRDTKETRVSDFFRHVLTHELVHTGQSPDWSDRNGLDGMMTRDHQIFAGHSARQADIILEIHEALTEHLHLLRTGRDEVCQRNNKAYWKQVEALREVLRRADIENEEEFVVGLQTVPPDVAVYKLDRALQKTGRKFFDHWLEVSTPIAAYIYKSVPKD